MFVEEAEAVCQWGFDGMSAVGAFMFEGYTFGDAELAVKFGTVGGTLWAVLLCSSRSGRLGVPRDDSTASGDGFWEFC